MQDALLQHALQTTTTTSTVNENKKKTPVSFGWSVDSFFSDGLSPASCTSVVGQWMSVNEASETSQKGATKAKLSRLLLVRVGFESD